MKDVLKLKFDHFKSISSPNKVIEEILMLTEENSVTHYENVIYSLL